VRKQEDRGTGEERHAGAPTIHLSNLPAFHSSQLQGTPNHGTNPNPLRPQGQEAIPAIASRAAVILRGGSCELRPPAIPRFFFDAEDFRPRCPIKITKETLTKETDSITWAKCSSGESKTTTVGVHGTGRAPSFSWNMVGRPLESVRPAGLLGPRTRRVASGRSARVRRLRPADRAPSAGTQRSVL
jgi:hypothetical protein